MKRILVDLNHPAHVHLFRHFITEMRAKGHPILVTAKRVPAITELLTNYNIDYVDVGPKPDGLLLKYAQELLHVLRLLWLVIRWRIDIGIGVSMALPMVAKLSRMKAIALDDDDLTVTPTFGSFIAGADLILNPSSLAYEDRGPNRLTHNSFHELAYLHPDRFRPDPNVLAEAGLAPGEPFFILRFNVFKAHHDAGARGLSLEQKLQLIRLLEPHGRLFITTERETEPQLQPYKLRVAPHKVHSLMYYATLFVGDSQTMVSEAALLGTPALKLNSFAGRLAIPNEIEQQYGLCYAFLPHEYNALLAKVTALLALPDLKGEWQQRKAAMLRDKIDLTAFLVDLVAHFPERKRQVAEGASRHFAPAELLKQPVS